MLGKKTVSRPAAVFAVAGSTALLAGCAIPILGARGLVSSPQPLSTVAFASWGPEYDDLAAKVDAAITDMEPADGFVRQIAPRPATPTDRWTVVDETSAFRAGSYRLIAYCAGTGTMFVDYNFQLGALFSTGIGNFVTCEPGTTVSASDIDLPLGANHLRIEVNPVDMYGDRTEPRAALGFTIQRAPS